MFPVEIWDKILAFATQETDVKILLRLAQVCTTFRDLLSCNRRELMYEYTRMPPFLQKITTLANISLSGEVKLGTEINKVISSANHYSIFDNKKTIYAENLKSFLVNGWCRDDLILHAKNVERFYILSEAKFNLKVRVRKLYFYTNIGKRLENVLLQLGLNIEKLTATYHRTRRSFDYLSSSLPLPNLKAIKNCSLPPNFLTLYPRLKKMKYCLIDLITVLEWEEPILVLSNSKIYLSNEAIIISKGEKLLLLNRVDVNKMVNKLPPDRKVRARIRGQCPQNLTLVLSLLRERYADVSIRLRN